MVNLNLTLEMDSIDADMSNNSVSAEFEITDLQWGRDNGEVSGLAPFDGTVDYIQMPLYQVLADVTVYGVDVAIMEGSEDFTPVRVLGGRECDEALTEQYGGELTSSPEIALVPGNTNDGAGEITWYTFVFDEPYEAVEGDFLARRSSTTVAPTSRSVKPKTQKRRLPSCTAHSVLARRTTGTTPQKCPWCA